MSANVSESPPINRMNASSSTITSDDKDNNNGQETIRSSEEDGKEDMSEVPLTCAVSPAYAVPSSFSNHQQDESDDNDNGEEEEDMTDAYEPQQQLHTNSELQGGDKSTLTLPPSAANPLHSHYHPFMLPSDQSLKDARTRLHTALEQTRILREMFTKRLWGKYNIKMTPVESSIEEIVERCQTDTSLARIQQIQNIWSWEKRIEGILDPPLVPMLTGASSALPSGAGGGSGGFSGIILPEDEHYFDAECRDLSSGNGKRISGASAAAAKIILDRARLNAVARSYVFSDMDKAKYGNNGPIAVCLKSSDVANLSKHPHLHTLLKKRRWSVANIPRGGVVQLQPNTNVGVMGKEVLGGMGSAAVTIVHAPNLQALVMEDTDHHEPAQSAIKTASDHLPKLIGTISSSGSAPKLSTVTPAMAIKRIAPSLDKYNNKSASLVAPPVASYAQSGPKLAKSVAASTSTTSPSNLPSSESKPGAPHTNQIANAVVGTIAKPTLYPYQKRAPTSGINIPLIQQHYGIDLSLDENLILFHKSSSSFKAKVVRHFIQSHYNMPSLVNAWSLITCQRLLSFEKNHSYLTSRMGLRDTFIKRQIMTKLQTQQQDEKHSSNSTPTTNPLTAATLLPAPWKWMENASNLALKDGTCILQNDVHNEDQKDVIYYIGQVLDIFYSKEVNAVGNHEQNHKPTVVNNISMAYALKFKLTNSLISKRHDRPPQQLSGANKEGETRTTATLRDTKLASTYDSTTVYSVLAALGMLCSSTTFDEDINEGRNYPKPYSAGSSPIPPPPKFVEGQLVEALWQSPHEAHFSRPSTPFNVPLESTSLITGTQRLTTMANGPTDTNTVAQVPTRTTPTSAAAVDFTAENVSCTTKGSWYPAIITRVVYKPHIVDSLNLLGPEGSEYRYDVSYDDGDIDEGLKVHQIRVPTSTVIASDDVKKSACIQRENYRASISGAQPPSSALGDTNNIKETASKLIVSIYRRFISTPENHPCSQTETKSRMDMLSDAISTTMGKDVQESTFDISGVVTTSTHDSSNTAAVFETLQSDSLTEKENPQSKHEENENLKRKNILLPPALAAPSLPCDKVIVDKADENPSVFLPIKAKKARTDYSAEIDTPVSVTFVRGKQNDENDLTIGSGDVASKTTSALENYTKTKLESVSEKSVASSKDPESSTDTNNLSLSNWELASKEAKELEQALQWHAASSMVNPAPFLMCNPQINQISFPSLGHSSQGLQGSTATDSLIEHGPALSLVPSQLMCNTGNGDFGAFSNSGGQMFPFGVSTNSSGVVDSYAHTLSVATNNGQGITSWERTNPYFQNLQAARMYQSAQHNAFLSNRTGYMFGAPRGLTALPVMQIQAQQHAAAQMQRLLMASAAKWAPPRPHTAHSFSPRISETITNPMLSGTTSLTLRPSSAGSLTSQSLAAGMATSSRDYLMMESMAKNRTSSADSVPNQTTTPAVEERRAWPEKSLSIPEHNSLHRLTKDVDTKEPTTLSHSTPVELTEASSPVVSSTRTCDLPVDILPDSSEIADLKGVVGLAVSSSTDLCKPPLGGFNEAESRPSLSSSLKAKSDTGIDTSHTLSSTNPGSFDGTVDNHEKIFIKRDILNPLTSESSAPVMSDLDKTVSGVMQIPGSSSVLEYRPDSMCKSVGALLTNSYPDVARLIEQGKFPRNLGKFAHEKRADRNDRSDCKVGTYNLNDLEKAAIEYLLQLGNSSPVAPTWVLPEIKKKIVKFPPLTVLGLGNKSCPFSGVRQVLSALLSQWVWHNYRPLFQRAFTAKSGVGVDNESKIFHECNFIVETAVECCLLRTAKEILALGKDPTNQSTCTLSSVSIASIASQVLNGGVTLNSNVDYLLMPSNMEINLSTLDKNRNKALQFMIYERVLLTTFVARTMIMTEKYAFAYLKFMLVVGEAVGHAKVCQFVNDDTLYDPCILSNSNVSVTPSSFNYGSIWTFLPYDFVTSEDDDLGCTLQDPCRPRYGGFTQGMDKVELMSRAHAKALLQRCLFKLQQKYGFQGGTAEVGPYEEYDKNEISAPTKGASNSVDSVIQQIPSSVANFGVPILSAAPGTPRTSHPTTLKRKSSFTGREIDATGGASHVGALLYPAHYCAPLVVQSYDIRSVGSVEADEGTLPIPKKPRTSACLACPSIVRHTEPIDWYEVAKLFQPVALPDQVASAVSTDQSVNIFAPDVRKLDKPIWELTQDDNSDNDEDSESEDISDDAVLARHQKVLDLMKQKLDVAMVHRSQGRGRALPRSI